MPACCAGAAGTGPGFATPLDAYKSGQREQLAYVPVTSVDHTRPDYLATIDLDPASPTHSQVIARLPMPHLGDELHHSGWNACSSCYGVPGASRSRLILPALGSSRLYAIDVATDPRAPRIDKEVSGEAIADATGLAWVHTSHCLGNGTIMVSAMGDTAGEPRGGFILFDQELKIQGAWSDERAPFGYDFWYQPQRHVMVSSGWGAPASFSRGFDPKDLSAGRYANELYIWNWKTRKLAQTIPLGDEGITPLEVRFLHDPAADTGFVGAALASNVLRFHKAAEQPQQEGDTAAADDVGTWAAEVVIRQEWTPVEGWALPAMPPLITDILVSLDDRFLYFSNWLRGDICQYDIRDPAAPKLVGQVFLGGAMCKGGGVLVTGGPFRDAQPAPRTVRGKRLEGGPQMLQLSLDGTRLYVTSSLYSPWDKQFYPAMAAGGSWMLRVRCDTDKGGLSLDEDFLVDFGAEPGGPGLAHEVRFPGGDSTSDIWY